jgi:hypothetical protein
MMHMISSLESLCQAHPEWHQYQQQLREAAHLSALVWVALQMRWFIARRLVEQELAERASPATA